jgi:nucleotide-binding universal stress UspA family protein
MRDTILVPVDGSDASRNGLHYACRLAKRLDASLRVLHVAAIPYVTEPVLIDPQPFIAAGQAILADAATQLAASTCDDAHYDVVEGRGNPGSVIVRYAEEHGCTQIVMSARGHTPLTHLMLGSVSDYVVHHAHCPVTIVR